MLSAGRNVITQTSIRLSAPSGINFEYSKAALDGDRAALLHFISFNLI